jgi:hypothetical protein
MQKGNIEKIRGIVYILNKLIGLAQVYEWLTMRIVITWQVGQDTEGALSQMQNED